MPNIVPFAFETFQVRTITGADGEPWFVAADVCAALDLDNVTKAILRLDDDERSQVTDSATLNSNQGNGINDLLNVINESGLYSLVLSSRKPEAKRFKKWITSEVLPSIRKTGRYAENLTPCEQLLANAQRLVDHERALATIAAEQERLSVAQVRTQHQMDQVASQVQALVNGEDFVSVVGWANTHKMRVDSHTAAKIGKKATKRCAELGVVPGKAPHPLFGEVNTYPREVLDELAIEPTKVQVN